MDFLIFVVEDLHVVTCKAKRSCQKTDFVEKVVVYKELPKFVNKSKPDLLSSHNKSGRC